MAGRKNQQTRKMFLGRGTKHCWQNHTAEKAIAGKTRSRAKAKNADFTSLTILPTYPHQEKTCGLTVCVSGFWAERGFCLGAEKARSQKQARKSRRLPPVRCTHCWAWDLKTRGSVVVNPHADHKPSYATLAR